MGMESFFVVLLPEGIQAKKDSFGINYYDGNSNLPYKIIIDYLKKQNIALEEYKRNEFIINKAVLFKVGVSKSNEVEDLVFEVCFYHYTSGKEIIYNIGKLLINRFAFRFFHPGIKEIPFQSYDNFSDLIDQLYSIKYADFKKNYGELTKNGIFVLPGKSFGEYLETKK